MFPRTFFRGWILLCALATLDAHAQPTITNVTIGTAFRYQGAIRGVFPNSVFPTPGPQSGTLPFQFSLWNDPADTNAAAQIGSNLLQTLTVSNGFFSTMLDFGEVFKGQRTFLEVAVYAPSNTLPASSNWITVNPRSEIGAVPYAQWARSGGREILRSEGEYVHSWRRGTVVGDGNLVIPGGFEEAPLGSGPGKTNFMFFESRSTPKIVEEARIFVGSKHWSGEPPICASCYVTIALEVWAITNRVVLENTHNYTQSLQPVFVRSISTPTNLVFSSVSVGDWLPLSLTNSTADLRITTGERLRLSFRGGGPTPGVSSFWIMIAGEAIVRDAP